MNRLFFESLKPGDKIVIGPTDLEVATIQQRHPKSKYKDMYTVLFSYKKTRYCLEYCSKTDAVYLSLKCCSKVVSPDMIRRADISDEAYTTVE